MKKLGEAQINTCLAIHFGYSRYIIYFNLLLLGDSASKDSTRVAPPGGMGGMQHAAPPPLQRRRPSSRGRKEGGSEARSPLPLPLSFPPPIAPSLETTRLLASMAVAAASGHP
jgi:hypothetical protein